VVKINPSLTVELEKAGQKITINIDEAKQIIKDLTKFVQDGGFDKKPAGQIRIQKKRQRRKKAQKGRSLSTKKILHISDKKRNEILQHVNRQLSARPKTLSNLLKGVSYVPNYLPSIRTMVEKQKDVAKKLIGKRTYYFRKTR
jgi:hypothetical protein